MSITSYFQHKSLRRIVLAFGTLFNGYKIQKDDGSLITVPISWATKQKWYTQLKQNASKDNLEAIILPRMAFSISSIEMDYGRKRSSLNKIAQKKTGDPDAMLVVYNEMPITVGFNLFIGTKSVDEGLQLLEQIVPFFTPSFNLTITELDELSLKKDILVQLLSVSSNFDREGSFDGDEIYQWELSFIVEANLYKNIRDVKLIKHIIIDVLIDSAGLGDETYKDRLTQDIDPDTAYIDDEWTVLEDWNLVPSGTPKI